MRNRGDISQHVTPATFGTNFTVPDRYSYTKNCPIKYTDPTGQTECDASQAIAGLGIVGLGAVPSGLGLGLAISGIIELSATSITIVGAFIGFHSLAVGTIMIGSGYAIMRAGVMAIIDSGCIPGLETDSTSP
jgi:hypothetical protein